MKPFLSTLAAIAFLMLSCEKKSEFSDWRGPQRNGIYPEKGLLQEWPEDGPKLAWSVEGLGYGHSSPAVAGGKVFVSGIKDTVAAEGTLFVFDTRGNKLFEKNYGKDFAYNFYGTRSTPLVADDKIYIESGMGAIYCLNVNTGDEIWSKDFKSDFGVDSVIQFGNSESVLIDGDRLICVPGGSEFNVVALDRNNGELIWSCAGEGDIATYNSPVIAEHGGRRLVIAQTAAFVLGIDAATGEKRWSIEQTQGNKIHANTPLFSDGKILVISAGREKTSGMVQLQLSDDADAVSEIWRNNRYVNLMGGIIKIDSCLYGSSYLKKDWQVISWNTGETLSKNDELGGGAVIYADSRFYCYSEREGEVALCKADPTGFEVISRFKVPLGTGEHWAHPVIADGMLYIRHGNALMAYNIKAR